MTVWNALFRRLLFALAMVSVSTHVGACKDDKGEDESTSESADPKVGASDQAPGTSAAGEAAPAVPDQEYKLRGIVRFLPTADANEIEILHEEIPDFVNRKGINTGMMSMVMPFALGPDVSLDGIAVNDKVSFTLHVDWSEKDVLKIVELTSLPKDAELDL